MEEIKLSDSVDYRKILLFTLPSVFTMVFISLFTMVDAYFVANYVGELSFAAVNLIQPMFMALVVVASLISSGGVAVVAKELGEGLQEQARKHFSMLTYLAILLSIILSTVCRYYLSDILILLGAKTDILGECCTYGSILILFLPFLFLTYVFSGFLITVEKPNLVFVFNVLSGTLNIILDYIFICRYNWGISGAAWGTGISGSLSGILPLLYFIFNRKRSLYLGKFSIDFKIIKDVVLNGLSEVIIQAGSSLIMLLINYQLLKYVGTNGIICFGVVVNIYCLFGCVFGGMSMGIAPIISYHFGANNYKELENLLKKGLAIVAVESVLLYLCTVFFGSQLSEIFISESPELKPMTLEAMGYFFPILLDIGFVLFISGFFTALNDAFSSAAISFVSFFVLDVGMIFILPFYFGINGLWSALWVANAIALIYCAWFLRKYFFQKYIWSN